MSADEPPGEPWGASPKDAEVYAFSEAAALPGAVRPPSDAFPWPTLALDIAALHACVRHCRRRRVGYRWNGKVAHWRQPMGDGPGACAGLDCSGFVGWALSVATDGALSFLCHRGSVEQHDWCESVGFKRSSIAAARRHDGALRIAFVAPEMGEGSRLRTPGHVALVYEARTLESFSGYGPGARPWSGATGWQARATVYVLTPS